MEAGLEPQPVHSNGSFHGPFLMYILEGAALDGGTALECWYSFGLMKSVIVFVSFLYIIACRCEHHCLGRAREHTLGVMFYRTYLPPAGLWTQ